MEISMRIVAMIAFFITACALTGCATVTEGTSEPLSIVAMCNGRPVTGAACKLANDKGTWYAHTPGSVVVHKSYQDLMATCTDQQAIGTARIKSSSNGGVWGNILAGGVIGYAVDRSNGAGFNYPTSLSVEMDGPCPGAALQPSTSKASATSPTG